MNPKKSQQHQKSETEAEVSSYRGRKIEVFRGKPRVDGERGTAERMLIDGNEISMERTELGYLSHENMFKVYSSPYELAEDLIRQWGDADVQPSGRREHPHDHGGQDHGHAR